MVIDGKNLGLRVKMVLRGHLQRPSGDPEGRILDLLEFDYSRVGDIGEPDGSSVVEKGADEGFVGDEEGLLLLAPGGTSNDLKDSESILGSVSYAGDVVGVGELGVERDTQNTGSFVERERGT